jgi:hypothetical protein
VTEHIHLQTLTFAEQKRRRRDPFTWILTPMGGSLLIGAPSFGFALAIGGPASPGVILAILVAAMAILASATAFVAARKVSVRYSLRDLFYLVLIAALSCAFAVQSSELARVVVLAGLIGIVTIWWTSRTPADGPNDYLARLAGNAVAAAVMVLIIGSAFLTALTTTFNGHGR